MIIRKSTFGKPFTMKMKRLSAAAALLAPFVIGGFVTPAHSRSRKPATPRTAPISGFNTTEVWQGQRPVLLLPVQYGSDFNLNKNEFSNIHIYAEQAVRDGLSETGKFGVFRPNSHAPALMRAVQDEKVTQDQVNTLVKTPNLKNADTVLSLMQFETKPLIAEFTLGKVTSFAVPPQRDVPQPPTVQVEVTGNLYELGNDKPVRTVTATSELDPRAQLDYRPEDRVLLAISDATDRVVQQFIEAPSSLNLPEPTAVQPPAQESQDSASPKERVKASRSKGSGVTRPRDVEFTTTILPEEK